MFVWFRVLCLSHRPSVIIIDSPRMRCCCCAMTGTMHDKLAKQKKIILKKKINSWFYWSPVPACTVDAWKKKPRHHQKNSPVRTQNKTKRSGKSFKFKCWTCWREKKVGTRRQSKMNCLVAMNMIGSWLTRKLSAQQARQNTQLSHEQ